MIREKDKAKKKRREPRISLGIKTNVVMTLLVASIAVIAVIVMRFILSFVSISEEVDHIYSIGTTSLGIIGTENSEKAANEIRSIYASIPENEKKNPADDAYLSNFPDFDTREDDIDELIIDSVCDVIQQKNRGIEAVGLCVLDKEHERVVVVRGIDDYRPGFWFDFNYGFMNILNGEVVKYSMEELRKPDRTKALRSHVFRFRVLIPVEEQEPDDLAAYMYIDCYNDIIYYFVLVFTIVYILAMSLLIILVWIFVSIAMRRFVIKPVKKLSKAVNAWSRSQDKRSDKYYFKDIRLKSNDELRDLKDAMESMEIQLHDYMNDLEKETKARERITTEIEIAARLQANMLPDKESLKLENFNITPFMRPARQVGGDFYDFFMIDEDRIALVIADVSDKGVPASLFMVVSRTIVKNMLMEEADNIAAAIALANSQLCDNNNDLMFVTVFACIYSINDRTLSYINAGHEDLIVYKKEDGRYSCIKEDHDILLGVYKQAEFTKRSIKLDEGDKLLLYTDGVTEAMDTNDELFGMDRLIDVLNKNASLNGDECISALWSEISAFQEGKNQSDDVTMLLFEV